MSYIDDYGNVRFFVLDNTKVHIESKSNPHNLTKADVGLSDVPNKNFQSEVDTNEDGIATANTAINTNTTDISDVKAEVDTNTAELITANTSISNNTTDIGDVKAEVDINTTGLATANTAINTNTTDISDVKAEVDTNTAELITANTSISNNTTDIGDVKAEVDINTTGLATANTAINTNTSDIGNVQAAVAINTTVLATANATANTDRKDFMFFLQSTNDNVSSNYDDIVDVKAEVDINTTGLATALAGAVTELNELSDVLTTTPQNNDVLSYNTAQTRWDNTPLSSIASFLRFLGDYDASGPPNTVFTVGDAYIVNTAGNHSITSQLGVFSSWKKNDWLVRTPYGWSKIDNQRLEIDDITTGLDKTWSSVKINDIKAMADTNTTELVTANTAISTNTTDIGDVKAEVDINTTGLETTNTAISTNTTDIGDVKAEVDINTTGLATANTAISNNTTDIGDVKAEVDINTTTLVNTNVSLNTFIGSKGMAGGLCELDLTQKIPIARIPVSGLSYKGSWNVATNIPVLDNSANAGDYYIVCCDDPSIVTTIDGISDWKQGDFALFNGTLWQKIDNTAQVVSVNDAIGTIHITSDNVGIGHGLAHDVLGTTLRFKSLSSTDKLSITTLGGNVTLDVIVSNLFPSTSAAYQDVGISNGMVPLIGATPLGSNNLVLTDTLGLLTPVAILSAHNRDFGLGTNTVMMGSRLDDSQTSNTTLWSSTKVDYDMKHLHDNNVVFGGNIEVISIINPVSSANITFTANQTTIADVMHISLNSPTQISINSPIVSVNSVHQDTKKNAFSFIEAYLDSDYTVTQNILLTDSYVALNAVTGVPMAFDGSSDYNMPISMGSLGVGSVSCTEFNMGPYTHYQSNNILGLFVLVSGFYKITYKVTFSITIANSLAAARFFLYVQNVFVEGTTSVYVGSVPGIFSVTKTFVLPMVTNDFARLMVNVNFPGLFGHVMAWSLSGERLAQNN
jgi:hypothetical protein